MNESTVPSSSAPASQRWATVSVAASHVPIVRPRIGDMPTPPDTDAMSKLSRACVPDVADLVGPLYTMSADIRPLYTPAPRLLGTAITVKAVPGDNFTIWGALHLVREGTVLVIDWKGYTGGGAGGGGLLVPPAARGLAGVVVDGAWRDVPEVQALGIPLYGRAIHPTSPQKVQVGEINVPVVCAGVVVEPGDVVMADGDGSVVVPRREVGRVADAVAEYRHPGGLEGWDVSDRLEKLEARTAQFLEQVTLMQQR